MFCNSLRKVEIKIPDKLATSLDSLTNWLKRVALRTNAKIEMYPINDTVKVPNAELVSGLKIANRDRGSFVKISVQSLVPYSNLKRLSLECLAFHIKSLELFPNLEHLLVGELLMSRSLDPARLLRYPRIKVFKVTIPSRKNVPYLTKIASRCFPSLIYFHFLAFVPESDIPYGDSLQSYSNRSFLLMFRFRVQFLCFLLKYFL